MTRVRKTARAAARTTRARVSGRGKAADARARFPAIEAFVAGYLNQDVHEIYGGPLGAASAFVHDASPDEVAALLQQWAAFRAALPHGASADRLARFQHAFAAGWTPSRFSQVAAVFARLARASQE